MVFMNYHASPGKPLKLKFPSSILTWWEPINHRMSHKSM